jgi:SPP1 gp7 family putative phage head morphogenesis protein
MAWRVTADPDRFDEAMAWFESRFPITEAMREELAEYAGSRAWTVAGVSQLDIILEIYESIRDALEVGTPLDEWRTTLRQRIGERWGKQSSARLETIFRTNVQTSYNSGRYVQMKDPDIVSVRPYWMYDAVMDSRTTEICEELNRTVLHVDDAFWDDHTPPLHYNCRSSLRSLTKTVAEKRGISESAPDIDADGGFGKAPTAEDWRPNPKDYPADLWRIYEQKQAK